MTEPTAVLAATLAAVAAAMAAVRIVPPVRPLAGRTRPYAQVSRSRLGRSADLTPITAPGRTVSTSTIGRVLVPMFTAMARRLSLLVDAPGDEQLQLRLRQAGFPNTSPEQYRMRQLGWAVGGAGTGGALGLVFGPTSMLLLGTLGLVYGATYWRGRVNAAITGRTARMRIELYTVAQLLAMMLRTGHGTIESIHLVVRRSRGPVVEELSEAMSWIAGGLAESEAFERLAEDTPEPAAARLYRLLATGTRAGSDLGKALLIVSDDLRSERREDVERQATRRRGAMLIPTIVVMAPVVLIFIAAPLPSLVLGGR